MGFENRPYYRDSSGGLGGGYGGGPRIAMPKPSNIVKYLLIINVVVYIIQIICWRQAEAGQIPFMEKWFAAISTHPFQVWRLISFQFLHGGTFHLFFNMIGLYFLGPTLEHSWGSRQFLIFFLVCGFIGGLVYMIASNIGLLGGGILVGASGGVLGMLVACAILFPHFVVILLLFPVPIRFAAVLLTVVYIFSVLGGEGNAGGNLCHLGGMATGFLWVRWRPYFASFRQKAVQGAYQARMKQQQQLQFEVDRILAKVREQGIQSLSRREKQVLEQATEEQKKRNIL
ncbi:MAG: rhomboid family intramembrane serine protease [Sedimentisphaerales bacterium]|nr:rhomboid family intramembrane serine protease [Sedimentisphaerales bacterium]